MKVKKSNSIIIKIYSFWLFFLLDEFIKMKVEKYFPYIEI